jgi:hypothetical protein
MIKRIGPKPQECLDLPRLRRQTVLTDALRHQILRFRTERLAFDMRCFDEAKKVLREVLDLSKDLPDGYQLLETKRTQAGVYFAGVATASGKSTKLVDAGEVALEQAKTLATRKGIFDAVLPAIELGKLRRTELALAQNAGDKRRFTTIVSEMAKLSSRSRDAYYLGLVRDSGNPLPGLVPVTSVLFDGFYNDPVLSAV